MAILGSNTTTGTDETQIETQAIWGRFTATSSGTSDQFCLYISSGTGFNKNAKLAVYDDSSGNPNNKLSEVTITLTGQGQNCVSFTSFSITSSTVYHLGTLSEAGTSPIFIRDVRPGDSSTQMNFQTSQTYPTLPDPAS